MKKGNLSEFLAYLLEQVAHHSMYVWGGQGETGDRITEHWIRRREQDTGGKKINGRYYSYADLAVNFWKTQCDQGYHDVMSAYDCSGLLVHWLKDIKGILSHDTTAAGLKGLCTVAHDPRRGYWVFKLNSAGRATHVGVLISDDEVCEAKGRVEGVVITPYVAKQWDYIGIPSVINFDDDPPAPVKKYIHPKGSVRVREGNGTQYKQIKPTATADDLLPYLGQSEESPNWYMVAWSGRNGYITDNPKYTEVIEK